MNYFKLLECQTTAIILNKLFYNSPKLFHFILQNFNSLTDIQKNIPTITTHIKIKNTQRLLSLTTISVTKELTFLKKNNIHTLTLNNPKYPSQLKELTFPPPLLFYKGNPKCLDLPCLAIVGPRKPSTYGKQVASQFAKQLCKHFCIVSGFAQGIDTIAHQECVKENQPTIAIMGVGLDQYYPEYNSKLAYDILNSNGLLLSEIPLFSKPEKHHFPLRNQSISGLSQGVLVIEAQQKSGSLITANFALEQNREVFAIPGNILTKTSQGPHTLIQQGAKCTTCINDILEEFSIDKHPPLTDITPPKHLTENEKKIFNLCTQPKHIEDIIEESQIQINDALHCITSLEIQDYIKKINVNTYVCNTL